MGVPKTWQKKPDQEIEKLVNENIALAHFFTIKYSRFGYIDEADCLSLSLEGLLLAAQRWDEKTGVPFGAYAGMRINWTFAKERKRRSLVSHGGSALFIHLDQMLGLNGGGVADEATIASHIPDPNTIDPSGDCSDIHATISELVENLPVKERESVKLCFGINGYERQTLAEAGAHEKITGEAVRLRMEKGLKRLRSWLRNRDGNLECLGEKLVPAS